MISNSYSHGKRDSSELISLKIYSILCFIIQCFLAFPVAFGLPGPVFTKLSLASFPKVPRSEAPGLGAPGEMRTFGSHHPRPHPLPPPQTSRWVLGACPISKLPGNSSSWLAPDCKPALEMPEGNTGYLGISRKKDVNFPPFCSKH